ncbi:unnamed protein product [Camellia sinensis]|uniref:Uncharacterized protein n=1 Tax=Camellia sinensis var. sinensis TaxID=542762 RepID=A0A4S4EF17_CAMSN|nr:translocator protein homolog [Camellia sinensis]THG14980.1 hypothetical protein TEA_025111 [Camellia sinensis var. sinensis]
MAPETDNLVRHRAKDEPNIDHNNNSSSNNKGRRQRRSAMARRGIRSLAIAITFPVSLHVAVIILLSGRHRVALKPVWFPSPWILHTIFVGSAAIMGLCAWFVWAEGGFHRKPQALAFLMSYLALSVAWDPIVFGVGAVWVGLMVSVGMFGALFGCSRIFKDMNPIAADLVKLCLIWVGFVISLNLKLLYW